MRRQFLGKVSTFMLRTRSYLASDAIEVDEIEGYTGTRRRVLLDEVQLITLDRRRRRSPIFLWLGVGILAFLAVATIGLGNGHGDWVLPALGFAAPFLLMAAIYLALGTDYVTVFGKRGVAQIAFFLRKKRARELFALLRERAQEAQQRAAQPVESAEEPAPEGSASVA